MSILTLLEFSPRGDLLTHLWTAVNTVRICLFYVQLRCDRFEEELESYSKQVEEFVTFGDMSELNRYLRKAQALNSKLDLAMEKVKKHFNFKLHFSCTVPPEVSQT